MQNKMSIKRINISGKTISYGKTPFIIAEAGVNHNGKLNIALKLIDIAAKSGADAIKFQTFRAEYVSTKKGKIVGYQKKNMERNHSQLSLLKKFELKENFYPSLITRCKKMKIIFLSTPHGGKDSVDLLHKHKITAYKIGSGDLTNIPLLSYTNSVQVRCRGA